MTIVTRNPKQVCSVTAVPTYWLGANSVIAAENCAESATMEIPQMMATIVTTASGAVRLAPDLDNAYTGTTQLVVGNLQLASTGGAQAIVGSLVIGGAPQNATVMLLAPDQIAVSATVTVQGNGGLDLNGQSDSMNLQSVTNGAVLIGAGTLTTTAQLSLAGSSITATGAGQLVLGGDVLSQPSSVTRSNSDACGLTAPTGTVTAQSPKNPSSFAPISIDTMSPLSRGRDDGIPCTTCSLTDAQTVAGYP